MDFEEFARYVNSQLEKAEKDKAFFDGKMEGYRLLLNGKSIAYKDILKKIEDGKNNG